jgi:hypothetical protein
MERVVERLETPVTRANGNENHLPLKTATQFEGGARIAQ